MAYQDTAANVPADAVALTSTVAAGANPTKAEFDALRTDVSNLRAKLNALLAAQRRHRR